MGARFLQSDKVPGEVAASPGFPLGERPSRRAWSSLLQSHIVPPDRVACLCGSACAKDAQGRSGLNVGTSVIARMRSVCASCASGRPLSAKLEGGAHLRAAPATLARNGSGGNESSPQGKMFPGRLLRARVVTQQNFFALPLCHRPGCHDAPRLSVRTPARYCSQACCQAVRRVRDRESKWQWRGTLDGRAKRQHEYRATREPRCQADCQTREQRQPRAPPP